MAMNEKKKSNAKTRARIPNKIQWGLGDMNDAIIKANHYWKLAQSRAESEMDPVQLAALARLRDHALARMLVAGVALVPGGVRVDAA